MQRKYPMLFVAWAAASSHKLFPKLPALEALSAWHLEDMPFVWRSVQVHILFIQMQLISTVCYNWGSPDGVKQVILPLGFTFLSGVKNSGGWACPPFKPSGCSQVYSSHLTVSQKSNSSRLYVFFCLVDWVTAVSCARWSCCNIAASWISKISRVYCYLHCCKQGHSSIVPLQCLVPPSVIKQHSN